MSRASNLPFVAALLALLIAIISLPALAQDQAARGDLMDRGLARVVSEKAIAAGESGDLALVFNPDQGWYGYWKNPGDAGQGMRLDWRLPEGWEVDDPRYPVPQTYVVQGIMNHIFEGEYAVLARLHVPEDTAAGAYPVSVFGEWLTCSETLCVPQWATLSTVVTVGEVGEVQPRFAEWRALLPPLLDSEAGFEITGDTLRISIPLPATLEITNPHVFLAEEDLVDYAAVQNFWRDGDKLIAQIPRSNRAGMADKVSGIIALNGTRDGLGFTATLADVAIAGEPLGRRAGDIAPFWLLLVAALAGGLLLNLMPCVFPILSLKALTLARAGESEAQAKKEALSYTAGVMIAVLALGALMLALRAAGQQVGWAFQLQEPGIVVVLLVLASVITANLAGMFELPNLSVTSAGGRSSSFATGLLAAFVATPCTGPFMAAALGAALVLPTAQALLLFAALGLGLALPFLLLGYVPALRTMLPPPGPWMDRFRRTMALPMGLTALALIWLVSRIGGQMFALCALIMLMGILLGLVVTGRLQKAGKMAWPAFGLIAAPFLIFGAFSLPHSFSTEQSAEAESLHDPVAFSADGLAQARASDAPIFLWFTADWCLTCKVNESVAIEREQVQAAFREAGVIAMRGDWTRRDEEISGFLTEQGAAGVPLYLWYPAGESGEQLPQVLTPDMLVDIAEATQQSD